MLLAAAPAHKYEEGRREFETGRKDTYWASTRQQWEDAEVTKNSNRGDPLAIEVEVVFF